MIFAAFLDVFSIVVGVIVALTGMALVLLGGVALTEKAPKQGVGTVLAGLGAIALGAWLIGLLG